MMITSDARFRREGVIRTIAHFAFREAGLKGGEVVELYNVYHVDWHLTANWALEFHKLKLFSLRPERIANET